MAQRRLQPGFPQRLDKQVNGNGHGIINVEVLGCENMTKSHGILPSVKEFYLSCPLFYQIYTLFMNTKKLNIGSESLYFLIVSTK